MTDRRVNCWLLTGGTGLVGRFVLAELLRGGNLVAALVRSRASAAAAKRIEECLLPFEREAALLRPRVIDFDLNKLGLGLSECDKSWLQSKRLGVIHSAASIRFVADSPAEEPYLSNVAGTRNLLDFLRGMAVESFHYVSTAYVANRSTQSDDSNALCAEIPAEARAVGENDYESSKIAAERMIFECSWLPNKTILRPSIIVGESTTGYTSTFHGFYTPLQIGKQVVKAVGGNLINGTWFRKQLGMKSTDTKNFVPVDWVARAIVRIACDPALHGKIYHLTNPQAVSCADIQSAIETSLRKELGKAGQTVEFRSGSDERPVMPPNFREQMAVYESYFNKDPRFDCSNTLAALPDLPCPRIDAARLIQLADYALAVNFGWPKPNISLPECRVDWNRFAAKEALQPASGSPFLELQLLGVGAPPPIHFAFAEGQWRPTECPATPAIHKLLIVGTAQVFTDCILGLQSLSESVASGLITCFGKPAQGWQDLLADFEGDLKCRI